MNFFYSAILALFVAALTASVVIDAMDSVTQQITAAMPATHK